jgi:hypothetical protein
MIRGEANRHSCAKSAAEQDRAAETRLIPRRITELNTELIQHPFDNFRAVLDGEWGSDSGCVLRHIAGSPVTGPIDED